VGRWKLVAPKLRSLIPPDPVVIQVKEHKTTEITLTYLDSSAKGRNGLGVYGRPGTVWGSVASATRYRNLAALAHALRASKLGCAHLQRLHVISSLKIDGAAADCRMLSHRATVEVWSYVGKLPYVTGFGPLRGWRAVGPNWVIEPYEDERRVVQRIQAALKGQAVHFMCSGPHTSDPCTS
jgi:hypothetical protein